MISRKYWRSWWSNSSVESADARTGQRLHRAFRRFIPGSEAAVSLGSNDFQESLFAWLNILDAGGEVVFDQRKRGFRIAH